MKISKINLKNTFLFGCEYILILLTLIILSCDQNESKKNNFIYQKQLIKLFKKENSNNYRFIAHAGGGIENKIYTNSLEAIQNSIKNGFKLIEIDLIETRDGFFIGGHSDWKSFKKKIFSENKNIDNKPMLLEEVKKIKIFNKYTPITIDEINNIFSKNKELILFTDKTNNFKKILRDFKFDKNRIVVEVFGRDNYFLAIEEGIVNPMFAANSNDYDFILDNGIKLISAHSSDVKSNRGKYKKLLKKGVIIFTYTSNNENFINNNLNITSTGFYTDFWDIKNNNCSSKECKTY